MKYIDKYYLACKLLTRDYNSHKGDYGHVLLVCGSKNMPGAAVLATGAALCSGCGLVTLHSSSEVCSIVASRFPSAIFSSGDLPDVERYSAVVVGPGIGLSAGPMVEQLVEKCLKSSKRMLLDADALNILSSLDLNLPEGSVLTPHDGELRRFVQWNGDKLPAVEELVLKSRCTVVSKGYGTLVWSPDCDPMVNTTGNAGMAKGGSGDVLAGLIGGLMARGYSSDIAAKMGVWIHGYAGDLLSAEKTEEAYSSGDILSILYRGFTELYGH